VDASLDSAKRLIPSTVGVERHEQILAVDGGATNARVAAHPQNNTEGEL